MPTATTLDNLKDQLKALAESQDMTFKELAIKAGIDEKGLHHKFKRQSLTVKDLLKLLQALQQALYVSPIDSPRSDVRSADRPAHKA